MGLRGRSATGRSVAALACAAAVLSAATPTLGVVIRVPQDECSIARGLAAAAYGDTILVAPGTYQERGLRMKSGVCLRSESGDPESVTIDAWNIDTVIECWDVDSAARIEGLTFWRGEPYGEFWPDNCGGGIFCIDSSPTISNCVFVDNNGYMGGGGIYSNESSPIIVGCLFLSNRALAGGGLRWNGGAPRVMDCVFEGNHAFPYCGGGLVAQDTGGDAVVSDCLFVDNTASSKGGAIHCSNYSTSRFVRCTLIGNSAPSGAAIASFLASPSVESCTIAQNQDGAALVCANGAQCNLQNTIVVFTAGGAAIECDEDSGASLACCDLYGNAQGDWVGPIADQAGQAGNFSADPCFCAAQNPEKPYSLVDGSPCSENQQPICGLVGAWGIGCGETPSEASTWGRIKAVFR